MPPLATKPESLPAHRPPTRLVLIGGLALAVAATSVASILIRWSTAPPLAVAALRLIYTATLLLPWTGPALARPGAITSRAALLAALAGFFLAGHFAAWISSLAWTSVAASTALVSLSPLGVLLAGRWWLAERVSRRALLAAGLALAGALAISGPDALGSRGSFRGDLLALLGAAFMAGYLLIGRRLRPTTDLRAYVGIVYPVAATALAIAAHLARQPLGPYGLRDQAIFLGLALGPTILGHTVFNALLKHLPATTIAIATLAEPVAASLLALWLFGEAPRVWTVAGGLGVLAGMALFLRWTAAVRREDHAPTPWLGSGERQEQPPALAKFRDPSGESEI